MTESTEPMPDVLPDAAAEDIADQHRSVVADEPDSAVRSGEDRPEADEADAWEQDQAVPGPDDEDGPVTGGLG